MCPCNIHTPRAGRNDQIVDLRVHQCAGEQCYDVPVLEAAICGCATPEGKSKFLIPAWRQCFRSYPRLCPCPGSSAIQKLAEVYITMGAGR